MRLEEHWHQPERFVRDHQCQRALQLSSEKSYNLNVNLTPRHRADIITNLVSDFFCFSNNWMRFETPDNWSAALLSDFEDSDNSDLTGGAGVGKESKVLWLNPGAPFFCN
jgi:hypothetical protein